MGDDNNDASVRDQLKILLLEDDMHQLCEELKRDKQHV